MVAVVNAGQSLVIELDEGEEFTARIVDESDNEVALVALPEENESGVVLNISEENDAPSDDANVVSAVIDISLEARDGERQQPSNEVTLCFWVADEEVARSLNIWL